ncbi:3-hydroxyacyl-CoA dehydrogenase NAD-binding domain-containing protein [Dietzia alimentaria]|uniref:3-hydroxyacyl-CoA dehydrogenase NAD-binding domain-containing protein n=1 Tax=Dietzia alimentaria TaxID=665550 RepID=UPI00029A3FE3|nr:3-hydroxyacyl-CoA dehydrogenase NAD-binding domain-containing protein [Dietzia alimentaria]
MSDTIRWENDPESGIVTLVMDDPDASANTMNDAYVRSMGAIVDRLEAEREKITGVILTSAKPTFFAGGNLDDLMNAGPDDRARIDEFITTIKDQLRRLEKLGKPVVAVIAGAALGGGLEIALACHHRIAVDAKGVAVGLPEVGLGLLPGGGGLTRTVRMLGLNTALQKVLLTGAKFAPAKSLKTGLVDNVVPDVESALTAAREWIDANPEAVQPWDTKGFRIPGGTPASPGLAAVLPALPATIRKQTNGSPAPAPRSIISAAVEGSQVDLDSALRIESRYLVDLACGQISTNMIKALFFDMNHVSKGGARPEGVERFTAQKVAVVGAGMMGAGIAYCAAVSGAQVLLKDMSLENAEKGKAYSQKILDKAVERGKRTPEQRDEILARITPTTEDSDLAGCDAVIEAVFEDPELKKSVFAGREPHVNPDALLGTNTSTLPITQLAEGVTRPADFIGLHFFSPVDKMQLLEIVVGEATSQETIARAIDLALQIRKVPIVVQDSRGFFTSRVIGRFLDEAVAMVGEGVPASTVEQAALQAGYPAGPLALMDELTLTLPRKIREETKAGVIRDGGSWVTHPAEQVVDSMIDDFDRKGRSTGAGFYVYSDGARDGLWPGLAEHFGNSTELPLEDLQDRMLFAEAMDSFNCLTEGVLRSVADANVGSILGIGFPAWTGGVLQFIDGYPGGLSAFVDRARELAERFGERFLPPTELVELAGRGGTVVTYAESLASGDHQLVSS